MSSDPDPEEEVEDEDVDHPYLEGDSGEPLK